MLAMEGRFSAALDDARRACAISESVGSAWGQSVALITVYRVELAKGEIGAAMDSIRRCFELGERGGFAYAAIVTRADLAKLHLYCGDVAPALPFADEALATALERMPPATSVAQVARAEALLAIGNRTEARTALDQVDLTMFPEPDRTFLLAQASMARSRLMMAEGDADGAVSLAQTLVRDLGSVGVGYPVTAALVTLVSALLAAGRFDEAERELEAAIEHAERLGERTTLWEALAISAEVHRRRGADREAGDLRRRARALVDRIADDLPDEELRDRFLARDDVRALADVRSRRP
jgi:tetratricopeptide (TPR) repeat protein